MALLYEKQKKSVHISACVTQELKNDVEMYARQNGIRISDLVSLLLKKWINEQKLKDK